MLKPTRYSRRFPERKLTKNGLHALEGIGGGGRGERILKNELAYQFRPTEINTLLFCSLCFICVFFYQKLLLVFDVGTLTSIKLSRTFSCTKSRALATTSFDSIVTSLRKCLES